MFTRQKMDPKYMTEDMPIAATFISTEDSPHLKLVVVPVGEKDDGTGKRLIRAEGTGARVDFKAGTYRTKNKAMLAALLSHDFFGKTSRGFSIDPRDETGFWRDCGMVEAVPVMTAKPKLSVRKPSAKDITAMLAAVNEGVKARTDEDGKIAEVVPLAL